jgi:hypothetical protein
MNHSPIKFVCNVVIPSLVALTSIAAPAERIPYAYSAITNDQAVSVLYLQWPQSQQAITSLLGSPNQRSAESDWYLRPGGAGAVRIDFNPATGEAIGYGWEGP